MAKFKAVALCRVSTSKQRIEGSSLDAQEVRVRSVLNILMSISSKCGHSIPRAVGEKLSSKRSQ